MLVDDEVDITEIYALYLGLHNFDIITANSAIEALEKLALVKPDIIISDCMMPLVDGVEFSRRLKADAHTRDIPVILMSGAPCFHDLTSPTFELFLLKPVVMNRLLQEIRKLLA